MCISSGNAVSHDSFVHFILSDWLKLKCLVYPCRFLCPFSFSSIGWKRGNSFMHQFSGNFLNEFRCILSGELTCASWDDSITDFWISSYCTILPVLKIQIWKTQFQNVSIGYWNIQLKLSDGLKNQVESDSRKSILAPVSFVFLLQSIFHSENVQLLTIFWRPS